MSKARFEVRLTGADANLGDVDAADVAHLILGLQKAMQRTATQLLGRSHGKGGQPSSAAKQAASLRLLGIRDGSVVLDLEAPETDDVTEGLELGDASLAELAQQKTLEVISGVETDYLPTAKALTEMASTLGIGERNEAIRFSRNGNSEESVVLDGETRTRLASTRTSDSGAEKETHLVGRLYEADFEKQSALFRTQLGGSVKVRFDDEQAADVKEALREFSAVEGNATYKGDSPDIARLDLTAIYSQEQLGLEPDEFWTRRSLKELAESQGVFGPQSIEDLTIPDLTAEEADAFGKALGL